MSLKFELETWAAALKAYESQEYEKAISLFEQIADSSKILFNIGLIHATLGSHELAVDYFRQACDLDQYLAVSFFQSGVSNFLIEKYPEAERDFNEALVHMRENTTIDYEQLGLKFKLFSCEILFNRGLSLIYMGNGNEGMADLQAAARVKQTDDHNVINEAIGEGGNGFTVFSIPVGYLYRPSDTKLKNIKTKNYLGAAKVVAATDSKDAFTGFTGYMHKIEAAGPMSPKASFKPVSTATDVESRPNLSRSRTVATRPTNDQSGSKTPVYDTFRRRPSDPIAPPAERPPALGRSNTVSSTSRAPLSRPSARQPPQKQQTFPPSPPLSQPGSPPRTTSLTKKANELSRDTSYDDLLSSYADEPEPTPALNFKTKPLPQGQPRERVADWARNTRPVPPSRSNSGNSSNSKSAFRAQPSRMRGNSEGGYVDYDVGPTASERAAAEWEQSKLRIKIHHDGDTRAMTLPTTAPYGEFTQTLFQKLRLSPGSAKIRFRDEDGEGMVSLIDDSDWDAAVEVARVGQGRLEVYVL